MHIKGTEEALDIREKGAVKDGERQVSDRRLFMQLHVFGGCPDSMSISSAVADGGLDAVIYSDFNDPQGVGLLLLNESPDRLHQLGRALMNAEAFRSLSPRPELTMGGRTYAHGYEPDLEDALLHKPRRKVLNPDLSWSIWYPLRRKPEFGLLPSEDLRKILGEHARIGREYGEAGHAQDIRLASYGLDRADNDFVIGLLGSELHPLSHVVQEMRKTQQTARYIQSLGPFFVGRVAWQSPLEASKA